MLVQRDPGGVLMLARARMAIRPKSARREISELRARLDGQDAEIETILDCLAKMAQLAGMATECRPERAPVGRRLRAAASGLRLITAVEGDSCGSEPSVQPWLGCITRM